MTVTPPNAFSPESEDMRVAEELDEEEYEDSEGDYHEVVGRMMVEEGNNDIEVDSITQDIIMEEKRSKNCCFNLSDELEERIRNYPLHEFDEEYEKIASSNQLVRQECYIKNAIVDLIENYVTEDNREFAEHIVKDWKRILQPKNPVEYIYSTRLKRLITDKVLILLWYILEEFERYFGNTGCLCGLTIVLNAYKHRAGITWSMDEVDRSIHPFIQQFLASKNIMFSSYSNDLVKTILTHEPLATLRVILERGSEL